MGFRPTRLIIPRSRVRFSPSPPTPTAERTRHPEIPWRAIAGTRNRLAPAYFDVDLDRLWQIVAVDLVAGDLHALVPRLEAAIATPGSA